MTTVPLADLCTPVRQKLPDGAFQYIDVSAVSARSLRITSPSTHTPATAPGRARKPVRTNDTLIATIRPSLRRVALVSDEFDGAVASTAFCVLRPKEGLVDPLYLYYAVTSARFTDDLSRLQRGASYPAVTDADVMAQRISLPSLERQHEIAGLLKATHEAIAARDLIADQLSRLKAATTAKLFREGNRGEPLKHTKIGKIPESWNIEPLNALLREPLRNGHSAIASDREDAVPTLTLSAVTRRAFTPDFVKHTAADRNAVADLWLRDGDIFVERANTREKVGLAALYRGPSDFAIFPDLLIRVRVDGTKINPEVLTEWLLSPMVREYFKSRCRGAATSMLKIDQEVVSQTLVPVPGMDEQETMAEIIRALNASAAASDERRRLLSELFESTLAHLLGSADAKEA